MFSWIEFYAETSDVLVEIGIDSPYGSSKEYEGVEKMVDGSPLYSMMPLISYFFLLCNAP
ncbi:MAG: hypothetical protein ABI341_03055 [Nitrososphaera sp.]